MHLQLQPQFGSLERWADLARREGCAFEILDLFAPPVPADTDLGREQIRQYRQTGLAASLHGAFADVNPACGDPKFRELSRQRCRESCEAALALGARNVVFHSSAFPFLRGAYLDAWADSCAGFYTELAQTYGGLRLFLENAQDLDPTPLRALMDRISCPNVGICLDIGHARYSQTPLELWFDALHERIGYVHLSDNEGRFDDHLPLGAGRVDWSAADRLCRELNRETFVTLETGAPETTEASVAFLRQRNYFGLR